MEFVPTTKPAVPLAPLWRYCMSVPVELQEVGGTLEHYCQEVERARAYGRPLRGLEEDFGRGSLRQLAHRYAIHWQVPANEAEVEAYVDRYTHFMSCAYYDPVDLQERDALKDLYLRTPKAGPPPPLHPRDDGVPSPPRTPSPAIHFEEIHPEPKRAPEPKAPNPEEMD